MEFNIGFTVILSIFVILTGGGTACEGQCENRSQTDACELITESEFRCVYKTKFIESSAFNITSYQNKLYICKTSSVNYGTVTFECPFNEKYSLHQIYVNITALNRKTPVSNVINTDLSKLFRPLKASNVKINASDDVGIRVHGNIIQKPLPISSYKSVYVTFSSIQNFHEPMPYCWRFRGIQINKTVTGLHPYEEYIVKIYWKMENGVYCSPVTVGSIRTQPSIPTAAPEILKGSYSDTLHNNKSALYWKTISNYHENGPSVKYIIYKLPTHIMKDNYKLLHNFTSLIQLDNVSHYFNLSNLEQFIIGTVDEFDCSLMFSHDVVPGDHLLIRTTNAIGSSDAYSSMEFTSKGKHMVQHFIASQLNLTHFELSWSSMTILTTTFEVILYWCYGFYWPLPGWTECQNNISEMTISSSKLERTETSFKMIQIIPSDMLPLTIDNPSSPGQKPSAWKLSAADNTLPPSYLHLGLSIQYDEEFSPIVWNTTTQSDGPAKQNYLTVYIVIAVITLFILLLVCVCCRLNSKKCVYKRYKVTRPANFEQYDSKNGLESTVLQTINSAQYVKKQRHDSGVGTLSISTTSSSSSQSSPQIIIPMSSIDTSTTLSTEGSSPENTWNSSPVITDALRNALTAKDSQSTDTSIPPPTGGSFPEKTWNSSPVITDKLRNALTAKDSQQAKSVHNSHTPNSSLVLMLKPKSQSKDKIVADDGQLMNYSIATIHKESESEDSSSSTSLPVIKTNSMPTCVKNKLQEHQQQITDNSDTSDNDSDVVNYPPTSIVFRPDSEEIMY